MSKAISTKIIVAMAILFLLAGIAFAADAKDQGKDIVIDDVKDNPTEDKDVKKNETIIDVTAETSKEIKKDIGVSVKDKAAELVNYDVKKEKDKITISKDDTKGHTKTVLTLDKATAQGIDTDKDGKFGYARFVDEQLVEFRVVTLAELSAGIPVTFSEVIVNGLSGTRTTTFLNVTSGQTLNIQDSSPDAVTVSVGGSVPSYVAGIPTNGLVAHYPLVLNANDISGHGINGTSSNVVYSANGAYFNGNNSKITIPSNALLNVGNNFTYIWIQNRPVSAARVRTIYNRAAQSNTVAYDWVHGTIGTVNTTFQYSNGTARYGPTSQLFTPNKLLHIASSMNPAYQHKTYINGTLKSTAYQYGRISPTTGSLYIGSYQGGTLYTFNGTLRDFTIYNRTLSAGEVTQHYADGSGISFQPEPSSNFTGYNVGSGIAKTLDIDSTVTGIEYVDTTGGTHPVTVVEYYTNDTTVILDSHTSTQQTVNISHSTPATMDSGTLLPYPILDGYDGTATLTSDNANATISQNGTTFTIDTGYLPAGQTFNYLVTIPASFRTSGSYTVTSYNVTSGTTIDVPDGAYTGAEVRVGGSVPSYVSGIPRTGLLGEWTFDNSTYSDTSGMGHTGSKTGNVSFVDSKDGTKCLYFDGTRGYISLGNIALGNKNATLIADVKPLYLTSAVNRMALSRYYGEEGIGIKTTGVSLGIMNGVQVAGTNAISNTTWTQLGITYNGSTASNQIILYRNASQIKTGTSAINITRDTNGWAIGIDGLSSPTLQFIGYIDNVRMYTQPLSLSEFRQVYAGGSGVAFQPEPSYNFTGYDVSSGTAKTLSIDSTVTGIEVVNTAGTTLASVTATLQMDTSSDIINVIESTSSQQHWANITLNPGKDYTDYVFTYPRPTGWTGSATMLSNNTAATVTSNNTHFMIDMGPLTTNETKYYNVGITSSITSFIDVPAVTVVIITAAGAFIGASFIGAWYRKRKAS